jgi:dephospho-CoA kinase
MSKIIGLTGGIGSGKTAVALYMKSLGIPVYIADEEAKKLMASQEMEQEVVKELGTAILSDGHIDKKKLAQVVFNDSNKLQRLNSIVHPKVKQHFDQWVQNHHNHPWVVKETAILFESGSYADCDLIITITAPVDLRIQRVISRDNTTKEQVLQRIQNQWTDEQRIAKSDYTISNISVKETEEQVNKILNLLKNQ